MSVDEEIEAKWPVVEAVVFKPDSEVPHSFLFTLTLQGLS
jgi:hypothetical protein